jgi:hypothetical protein
MFVSRLLQNEQKRHRLEVCRELQQQLQEDPNFLSKIFIGEESWVYGNAAMEGPFFSSANKTRQFKSKIKSTLIWFILY